MGNDQNLTLERLQGTLSRVRFASDDGLFSVCELTVEDRLTPVTIVGNILSTRVGETVEVAGEWKEDPRFGRQFSIHSISLVLPSTKEGIEKYLSSDLMEGIGPTLASRIVEHFGEATLQILAKAPHRIQEVEGIGKKRAAQIMESWSEGQAVHSVMVFLRSHGVSAALSVKVFRQYGPEAVEIIQRNPYRMVEDIRGIGFQTADQIARHVGIDEDSPERVRAGVVYLLESAHNDGHVYLPLADLQGEATNLLGPTTGDLKAPLLELAEAEKIYIDPPAMLHHLDENARIYSARAYRAETGAAGHLTRLLSAPSTALPKDLSLSLTLEEIENRLAIELANAQRDAVISVFQEHLAVITGGPGTGKTTIVQAIVALAHRLDWTIALAAPTGRAARRLSEATGEEARTIHRLLEYNFYQGGFQFDEDRPLVLDLLVIDEASMIDIYLLHALLRAVPTGATLVFVGDIDQLPSVGPGQVLRDLIDSGAPSVVRLTEIFRQAKTSSIVLNAHRINSGLLPIDAPRTAGELVDFYTLNAPDPEEALEKILELVTKRIPDAFGFHPLEEIQILSPMYRGAVGCDHINQVLQAHFTGGQQEVKRGRRLFRLGDRVMQTSNNYDQEVFNGDVGRVIEVFPGDKKLRALFDGRKVTYENDELDQLTLAYAVTVHKSQGSEYPAVIIPVTTQHYVMLQRNLLYTAVTRGRKLVILVGTERAVRIAVENARSIERNSGLAGRLT